MEYHELQYLIVKKIDSQLHNLDLRRALPWSIMKRSMKWIWIRWAWSEHSIQYPSLPPPHVTCSSALLSIFDKWIRRPSLALIIMRCSTKRALIWTDGRDATLSSKLSAYNGRITGNVCAVDIDATKEVHLHSHKIWCLLSFIEQTWVCHTHSV